MELGQQAQDCTVLELQPKHGQVGKKNSSKVLAASNVLLASHLGATIVHGVLHEPRLNMAAAENSGAQKSRVWNTNWIHGIIS